MGVRMNGADGIEPLPDITDYKLALLLPLLLRGMVLVDGFRELCLRFARSKQR